MKKMLIIWAVLLMCKAQAQVSFIDTTSNAAANSAANIIGNTSQKLQIGSYAQIDYNQQIGDVVSHSGNLDVHRFILFLGYHFNDKTTFVTELEAEHVKEFSVEQAFVNYNIIPSVNFRAGLLLIPMGIVNEYHEPTTFNGVERPNTDKYIIPSTWREVGAGFAGKLETMSLRYQLYIVNGFNGYDGSAKLRGLDGLRKGRQKGAKSYITSPVFSGKLDYYGLLGLKIGLSGYLGNSQSKALDGVLKSSTRKTFADSTYVGVSMVGLDYRYNWKAFKTRGQFIYASLRNTAQYNRYTGSDLGAAMLGYYIEGSYNLLAPFSLKNKQKLDVFCRYENYNTHQSVANTELSKNLNYDRTDITMGLSYHIARGVVLKGDYQRMLNKAGGQKSMLNFGIGTWF